MNNCNRVKLIIGLGNPGSQYQKTKHNIGFQAIDAIYDKILNSKNTNIKCLDRARSICQSLVIQIKWNNNLLMLAKPMTYMNNSGYAVSCLIKRFDIIHKDICVIYDDIHLDLGVIRIRKKGSDGGQKGMQSIVHHLGTTDFPRLRIGIGEPIGDLTDYVLSHFSQDEEVVMTQSVERVVDAVDMILNDNIQTAMNRFNARNTN